MASGNVKTAYHSIKSARWRSFLTMLGVIVGVASVITVVSIGEGVKKQITSQINLFGPDLITVRPGKPIQRDDKGNITGVNFMPGFSGVPLSEQDLKKIRGVQNVKNAVPLSYLTAIPEFENRKMDQALVFGTNHELPDATNQKIAYGAFFDEKTERNVAVIGSKVAESLFREQVPIGQTFTLQGQSFNVVGVFEEFDSVTLGVNVDYGSAIFIPLSASKKLISNQTNIQQILVKPHDSGNIDSVVSSIGSTLREARGGQEDFTILQQEDTLAIADTILTLLTGLITGIAAISLLVGGIGIMNVMIVSVTERTKEIGVRKAVGATNSQIMSQFLLEAAVLSVLGGIAGIILSLMLNFILRLTTELQPIITFPIMIIAVLISMLVGIVFGVAPALKAARKDPIDALRSVQ